MSPHLFIFTIGPVQSFIAQARKTRDLYAGSTLLSELTKVAIEVVGAANVIFPYVKNQQGLDAAQSLPNRFIARVTIAEGDCQAFGTRVAQAVREAFRQKAKEALGNRTKPLGFDEQIAQHLQIHWVVQGLNKGYAQGFKDIEENLGIAKNLRTFAQYDYAEQLGEQGRKCSLDGERNAVFFGKGTNPLYLKRWNPHAHELPSAPVVANEGLSAVSFLKRFYKQGMGHFEKFPSTAKVALMESLRQATPEVVNEYSKFFGLLEGKQVKVRQNDDWTPFGHQFFFEENLTSKQVLCADQLANARVQHQKVATDFAQKGLAFQKYYAVLMFDVDQMGSWLSGNRLKPAYQGDKLLDFHQHFSELLLQYADHASTILNPLRHNGQVVYAGGDDFLGFINLSHLFEVVHELRDLFLEKVSTPVQDQYAESGELLHFSAGIVIAHYKAPFAEVLKKARQMETLAKEKGDRNAFAIAAMKHSGEVQEAVFKWQQYKRDKTATCWQSMATIAQHLKNKHFSNKFIFNLSQELLQLAGIKAAQIEELRPQDLFVEMSRLIGRAAALDTPQSAKDELFDALVVLYGASENQEKLIRNFIYSLHIADFVNLNS
ncbi:type III-B CRISPR-associated protein Cas10/Cmr2 [Microscilla marina]|uniref:Crispr-associated protein, Crm2 family n=1 Tax=Microscilla marina ATCC 23134 TaxID=313606 RepID=A1ZP55_MICM2|nr:type III-B CRISPR-associated protein Cas10/Cmr2 [Microscilla marina]EAY27847.1 crispr-associated protein, Crm2 family [Microscilla marina ATCC 23134]